MLLFSVVVLGATVCFGLHINEVYSQGGADIDPTPDDEPDPDPEEQASPLRAGVEVLLDESYELGESFVEDMLGEHFEAQRQAHLDDLGATSDDELTVSERYIRRRVVLAAMTLGTYAVGVLVARPMLLAAYAIFLGQTGLQARDTWRELRDERKVKDSAVATVWMTIAAFTGHVAMGTVLMCPWLFARLLTFKTADKSKSELGSILGEETRDVWIEVDGVEVSVPLEQLARGQRLVVHAGEIVPVDGVVVDGLAQLDQHVLTGESQPVERGPGGEVFAGTLVLSGCVHVRMDKTREESIAESLGEVLTGTTDYREVSELRGRAVADKIALPTLLVGASLGITKGAMGALTAMTCFPGFNIMWAGPLSIINHLDYGMQCGVLIKDGRALERFSAVDTIVFDKTGTLTQSKPEVVEVHAFGRTTSRELLELAAAIERYQTHPLALAILEAHARAEPAQPSPELGQIELVPGYGLRAKLAEAVVRVGSSRFMTEGGVRSAPELAAVTARCKVSGHLLVHVGVGDELAGVIEIAALRRAEAREVIEALAERGLDIIILSGDYEQPTRSFARELGIERYYAQVLPEGKADVIEALRAEGRNVCFVGDGINDAIALKTADVSISLRGATTVAIDTAQIVLLEQDLRLLMTLCEISDSYEATNAKQMGVSVCAGVVNVATALALSQALAVSGLIFFASVGGMLFTSMNSRPSLAARAEVA